MSEVFDLIVVGAGPAGSTAAFQAAKSGFKVLLLERGKAPGEKNVFGGRIYAHMLRRIFGDFPKDVPYERFVVNESISIMDDDRCATLSFSDHRGAPEAADSFVARRSRFDKWLSEKAEEAGAIVVPGTRVDDLLIQDGQVRGIIAGGDRIEGRCVVDAEGVTATLSRKAGTRNDITPYQFKIGVKETVEIGKDAVESRFGLGENEGAAGVYVGFPSRYMPAGGAFVYTNRDSLSIGIVVEPREVARRKIEVEKLAEAFRMHPHIRRMIRGGKVIEYSAHMIPNSVPMDPANLSGNGFMVTGDAAGFFINNGYTYRGVDLAIASGYCAANTFIQAAGEGKFDASALSGYRKNLEEIGLISEIERFQGNDRVLHNERIFSEYPPVVLNLISEMFSVKGFGKEKLSTAAKRIMSGNVSKLRLLRDIYSIYRLM
jgi:electron transfer flavoprotein-quinone oxidoreductase